MSLAAVETSPSPAPTLRPAPALEPPYDDELAAVLAFVPRPGSDVLPFDEPDEGGGADDFAAQSTPRSQLSDPEPWAGRLLQATLEVLAGQRPVQQLMPWASEAVYVQLARMVRRRRLSPARLRSVHVSEPADGVAEVCAVIRSGNRTHAVAARLEGVDGRWRCTVLQFG